MGQMEPFPPLRNKARFQFAGILRFEHGKISERWVTWDNMAILSQLGHLPCRCPRRRRGGSELVSCCLELLAIRWPRAM
jgi:hypothetical protein